GWRRRRDRDFCRQVLATCSECYIAVLVARATIDFMNVRSDRRQAAIERMADHLLLEGLGAATLRPLAAAAGTSDRMLLYYFADKDDLLSATLHRLAARMTAQLDEAIPIGRLRSFPVLLEEVWAALAP